MLAIPTCCYEAGRARDSSCCHSLATPTLAKGRQRQAGSAAEPRPGLSQLRASFDPDLIEFGPVSSQL